jgi:ketosteroid isomerase-like protein
MNEKLNVQKIQELYAAFGRGDIPHIIANLTDDVRWVSHLEAVVPWHGDFSGKDRVPQFFNAIFHAVEVLDFAPQDFIAEGEQVVSVGEFAGRVRATGKTSRTRWVFLWKFRNGKVCSYEQFHDPAMAAAFR